MEQLCQCVVLCVVLYGGCVSRSTWWATCRCQTPRCCRPTSSPSTKSRPLSCRYRNPRSSGQKQGTHKGRPFEHHIHVCACLSAVNRFVCEPADLSNAHIHVRVMDGGSQIAESDSLGHMVAVLQPGYYRIDVQATEAFLVTLGESPSNHHTPHTHALVCPPHTRTCVCVCVHTRTCVCVCV